MKTLDSTAGETETPELLLSRAILQHDQLLYDLSVNTIIQALLLNPSFTNAHDFLLSQSSILSLFMTICCSNPTTLSNILYSVLSSDHQAILLNSMLKYPLWNNLFSNLHSENISLLLLTRFISQTPSKLNHLLLPLLGLLLNTCSSPSINQVSALNSLSLVITPSISLFIIQSAHFISLLNLINNTNPEITNTIPSILITLFNHTDEQQQIELKSTLRNTIISWIKSDQAIQKSNGYSLLSLIFQINIKFANEFLQQPQFISDIMEFLDMEKENVQISVLSALSNACIDSQNRAIVASSCLPQLEHFISQSHNDTLLMLSINILIKLMGQDPELQSKWIHKIDVEIITKALNSNNSQLNIPAIESLAFLSMEPFMKPMIVNHPTLLSKIFEISANPNSSGSLLYGISVILMNLTMYRKPLTKEQEQVMKLKSMSSGVKAPEANPLDNPDAVLKRNQKLVELNIVAALVYLAKSSTDNRNSCLANILLSLTSDKTIRGKIIQQGGFSVLAGLMNNSSEKISENARQAIARIIITTDPSILFKGTNALDYVSPLVKLCSSDDGLCQFESLLALTNLASIDTTVRKRIIDSKGIPVFESLIFSDNIMIRRASTEILCNMMFEQDVFQRYSNPGNSHRLKMIVALADSADFATRRAASGIMAILSGNISGCEAMVKETRFIEVLKGCLIDDNEEIQHRGIECVKNFALHFTFDVKKMIDANIIKRISDVAQRGGPASSSANELLQHLKHK